MPMPSNSTRASAEEMSQSLREVFGAEELTRLARETGFLVREREVTPLALVAALVCTLGGGRVQWLADILRTYNALTGNSVRYKPFHNQLSKPAFAEFMRRSFEKALNGLTRPILAALPSGKLARFRNIWLHDGTSFALKPGLAGTWPGRFSKVSPAAVELHVTMSALEDNPVRVSLTADKEPERPYAPEPDEVAGCLLLGDRGFEEKLTFIALSEANGSFIIRGKKNIRPRILKAFDAEGNLLPQLAGKRLSWELLPRCTVDLDIQWGSGSQTYVGRLVAIHELSSKGRKRFVYLHTNLPRMDFSCREVGLLYRLRWQIELLFKEWKSYANLHLFCTEKEPIAEGMIWSSLLAATLTRSMTHAAEVGLCVEMSTQRAAMAAKHYLEKLMRALLHAGQGLVDAVKRAWEYLGVNARRAHPERDRRTGRLASGLVPLCRHGALPQSA